MTTTTRFQSRKGFTLIEVLIVITIVALLISLILPGITQAREVARQAICSANLRQVGASFAGYANDNHNQYPIMITSNPPYIWQSYAGYEDVWLEKALSDYTNVASDWSNFNAGGKIWLCPSSPIKLYTNSNGKLQYTRTDGPSQSASVNCYKGLYYDFGEGVASRFTDPLWANYPNTWQVEFFTRPNGMPIQWCSMRNSAGFSTLAARSWHGTNLRPTVFMDGHVKKLVNSFYAGDYQDILFGKSSIHLMSWPASAATNWSNGGNYCLSEF